MTIHKKIKQARHVKGWTQEEIAEKLKITANAYGAIERGETQPTIPKLKKMCEVLEVELSELIDCEETQVINVSYRKSGKHHHYNISTCSPEYLQLQGEVEKQQLIIEMREKEIEMQQKEIENQKKQIAQLEEINVLLKNKGAA
jgi:transcriptional regulator with XRE-family HTH domain